MIHFYLGIANIPILISGGILNIFAFYCLVTFKQRSRTQKSQKGSFGNLEILLLALNISDSFLCLGDLPVKIVIYILNPKMTDKPRFLGYLDGICFWSSSMIVILIAFNNYIKISSPHNYPDRMPRKRIYTFLALILAISLILPAMIFVHLRVNGVLLIALYLVTVSLLSYLYRMITKVMKNANNRITNKSKASEIKNREIEKKVTKNVLTIIIAYALCSLTILVMLTIFAIAPNENTEKLIKFGVYFMTVNSIINPCIYVLNNKSYRNLRRGTSNKVTVKNVQPSSQNDIPSSSKQNSTQDSGAGSSSTAPDTIESIL